MSSFLPKILIVGNSDEDFIQLKKKLELAGSFNVISAASVEAALEQLESESASAFGFDLILVQATGGIPLCFDLVKAVKESSFFKVPLLGFSGTLDAALQLSIIQAGMLDCVDLHAFDLLVAKIQSILSMKMPQGEECRKALAIQSTFNHLIDDLMIARNLQIQTLPDNIHTASVQICGIYLPYEYLGGDLYYWQPLDEGRYSITMLDVMGHGTATALICMYLRCILPHHMMAYQDPAELIRQLNSILIQFNNQIAFQSYHCTAFNMVVDTRARKISYVNAGHPYVALFDPYLDVSWLDKGCLPIGIFESLSPQTETLDYEDGSRIFLYSDGIYDLLQQQSLNIEYMLNYIRFYGFSESSAGHTLDKLFHLIEQIPREDDVSLVYLELTGGPQQ